MSLFEHSDYDNHEQVAFHQDPKSGLQAIIAVHNTNLGAGLGGCRMWPYASSAEALTDVLRLSRGMTYKAAMAGVPQGGGKAVIIGNPRQHKSEALMQAMGSFVNSFNGHYIIAEDSGISVQDLKQMSTKTQYAWGNQARYSADGAVPDGNPAPATALGVFSGIQAAVELVFGESLEGKKIAIQGVGNVGLRLARHLHQAGARLFVSDIYDDNLNVAHRELGATIVANENIHCLDVDVFSPCALGNAINSQNVKQIQAKIIAGAANNQLASPEIDDVLFSAGKVYVPDYILNAGGIIDIYHQTQDSSTEQILRSQLKGVGETVKQVLNCAKAQNKGAQRVANEMAEQKFKILR